MLSHRCAAIVLSAASSLAAIADAASDRVQPEKTPAMGDGAIVTRPEMPKEVREVFERALREYAKVNFYSDRTILKFRLEAKTTDGADASRRESQDGVWSFQRPLRFAYRAGNDGFQLVSDGATQWTYAGNLKQYTEQPAPTDITKLTPGGYAANAIESHLPVRILLGGVSTPERMFEKVARWTGAVAEERDGEQGVRVQGEVADGAMGLPGKAFFSAWFDAKTGLVRQTRIDMTEAYRAYIKAAIEAKHEAGGQSPESVEVVEVVNDFRDVKADTASQPAVPADAFAFKPPEGASKVASLDANSGQRNSVEQLVGKPVPDFSAKLLTGEDFSISSLKGRIVVLDFWATWCGPCIKSIPSMQKIAEKYASQPVTILGVNQDMAPNDDQIKSIREKVAAATQKLGLTFKHVMDSRGTIGDKFFITAIPCTVILDKEGIVADVHIGAPPGGIEDLLSGKIDRLLKGEKLTDK